MNQHIEMMLLADDVATRSECPDRQVGGVLIAANGECMHATNTPKTDSTNQNHAEARLLKMSKDAGWNLQGAKLYVTCRPCAQCTAELVGQGLAAIYYRDAQPEMDHLILLECDGIKVDSGWIAGQREPLIEPTLMQKIQASWLARWSV